MTKKVWLSLFLTIALILSGIAAFAQDTTEPAQATPDIQADTVLAIVNGEEVRMSEISSAYQYYKQQYEGYGMDFSKPEVQQSLMSYVMNLALQNKLILQKAVELGLGDFTQEELDTFQTDAQTQYDGQFEVFKKYLSAEDATEEDKIKAANDYMNEVGFTVETLVTNAKQSEMYSRAYAHATEGVEIPDAAVESAYAAAVEEAKAAYAENLAKYGADLSSGKSVVYTPEGYRTVKHILVKFDKAADLKTLKEKLATLKEGDAEYADTVKQIDELMAEIQPKLDEITGKIASGEDFQALIDQYGEDGGMKAGSASAQTGYYMCEGTTTYVPEFTQAGMALEKVGDVSEPVLTSYGFHIIRYNSDVAAGEVPYEQIKEALHKTLLSEALNAAFGAKVTEWAAEAKIEYPEAALVDAAAADATEPAEADATEPAEAADATEPAEATDATEPAAAQ